MMELQSPTKEYKYQEKMRGRRKFRSELSYEFFHV